MKGWREGWGESLVQGTKNARTIEEGKSIVRTEEEMRQGWRGMVEANTIAMQ